jgi:hypothetical protein
MPARDRALPATRVCATSTSTLLRRLPPTPVPLSCRSQDGQVHITLIKGLSRSTATTTRVPRAWTQTAPLSSR